MTILNLTTFLRTCQTTLVYHKQKELEKRNPIFRRGGQK